MRHYLFSGIVALFAFVSAHALGAAQCNGEMIGSVCVPTDTGLAKLEVGTILSNIADWISFMFGSIAVIVLIVCGFTYLISTGDDSQAEDAKRCIKWAIVGIIATGLAFVVLTTIANIVTGEGPGGIFGG